MSSYVSNAKVKFIESKTNQEKFSAPLEHVSGTNFTINNTITVPAGLFMGTYNVSIEMYWNSSITSRSLPVAMSNTSLPIISYQGLPIIQNIQYRPLSDRSNNNTLYSGDFFNLTANIGVKNLQNSNVYPVTSSVSLTANFYNSSSSNQVLQVLSYVNLNNSKISVYGEIDPNLNIQNDVGLTLSLRIKYDSNSEYNLLYTNINSVTSEYKPSFILKKANIELDQNSVNFVIGSSNITQNEYTTLLVTFKILSNDNNQYVTGLKLNASLFMITTGKANETITLPAVTSLETNSAYQIQIPVNSLAVGQYKVGISPLNTNEDLGSFSLSILPVQSTNVIPIENFISFGAVSIAIILSVIAFSIKKKN